MKPGQADATIGVGAIPRVAASSDGSLTNSFGTRRSLAPDASQRKPFSPLLPCQTIDRRPYKLSSASISKEREREGENAVILLNSVTAEHKPGGGGAAIVGFPRLAPPERIHSARQTTATTPGATASMLRKGGFEGRLLDDRGMGCSHSEPVRMLGLPRDWAGAAGCCDRNCG